MSQQTVQMVGTALLHFVWQGAALAVVLFAALAFTRNAQVRYGLSVVALGLMALCPVATMALLGKPVVAVAPVIAGSLVGGNASVVLNQASGGSSFDWLTCLVWVWCGGVCLFAVRALGGWWVLQKLRRTAQEAIQPALLERCRRLQERIGIRGLVRYAYSENVDAPAVVGWLRPIVLIPLSAVAGLSVEQLDAILAHELAHIRRYDALVNLFQIAVETVLFYHPAVWWVNRVVRAERENCCDDIAVAVCGNASEYARALAAMVGGDAARPAWAMAANGGALKARIGRLLGMQRITHGIPRAGLAVLAVLCASCVVLAAGAFKQDVVPAQPLPPAPPPVAPVVVEPPAPSWQDGDWQRMEKQLQEMDRQLSKAEKAMKGSKRSVERANLEAALQGIQSQYQSLAFMLEERKAHQEKIEELRRKAEEVSALYATQTQLAKLVAEKETAEVAAKFPAPEEHAAPSYIDSLEAVGLKNLSVDELIGLKVQGVTADYVRQIRATGLNPSVHELMGLKVQGVTPEFIRALQSAGLGDLKLSDFMAAKVQGVTPEFIEKVRSHGFKDLTFRQLMGLKMAGVF